MDDEKRTNDALSENEETDAAELNEQAEETANEETVEEKTAEIEDETVARVSAAEEDTVVISAADESGSIPITPQDGEAEETEDDNSPEICILCEKNPADKTHGKHYDLCAECRESLIKSPLRFSGFVMLLIVICISVWGILFSLNQADTLKSVRSGDSYAQGKHFYSSINAYAAAKNSGWKTAGKVIDASNSFGYFSGISNGLSYFYDAKNVEEGQSLSWADKVGKGNINAPWNSNVKAIVKEYNDLQKLDNEYYAYISEYGEQLSSGEITADKIPYDKIIEKYEAAKTADSSKLKLTIINYFEYLASSMTKQDISTQLKHLTNAKNVCDDYDFLFIYPLTSKSIIAGEYDKALEYCKRMNEINADDKYGEFYGAQILRRQGKYDEALKKLDYLIDNIETTYIYESYYEAGVVCILKGDYAKAKEYVEPYYEDEMQALYSGQASIETEYDLINMYALLCKATNDDEGYSNITEMFGEDLEVSKTVTDFLAGKITAEQIFNEGEVDFE